MPLLQVASCPTIAAQLWAAVSNTSLVPETVSSLRRRICGSPSEKRVCCPSVPLGRLSELSHQVLYQLLYTCVSGEIYHHQVSGQVSSLDDSTLLIKVDI